MKTNQKYIKIILFAIKVTLQLDMLKYRL